MTVTLNLPIRTWAALDAALTFFRAAPFEVEAAQRLADHCRQLHIALKNAGVRCRYVPVSATAPGRSLLRLHVRADTSCRAVLAVQLQRGSATAIAEACLAVIEVQTDADGGALLDHEAEELQASRSFLTELRRQGQGQTPSCYGRKQLRWDDRRKEYSFTDQVGRRVHQHYLRAGAALN